jgi:putative transcriptional regulator
MSAKAKPSEWAKDSYLEGQLLLAMPTMTDKRFRRAVIYMCRHSDDGAMGIIVNQHAPSVTFRSLLKQLDLLDGHSDECSESLAARAVHIGGPVSTERGFVLHSDDYMVEDATLPIADGICLTATIDILKAIAVGNGPSESLLALGYAGWAPGQLESEIQANGWLHCAADHGLIFGSDIDQTYERALSKLGIDPTFLVSSAGHA